jgi:hypothetical protein
LVVGLLLGLLAGKSGDKTKAVCQQQQEIIEEFFKEQPVTSSSCQRCRT